MAKEQQTFITRLVKAGKFSNQSEAARESIRRMQREESDYLTPPSLTPAQVEAIYGSEDPQGNVVGRGALGLARYANRKPGARAVPRSQRFAGRPDVG